MGDIRTAVSEAVTNAIIHGYGHADGIVYLTAELIDQTLTLTVEDHGVGIADLTQAMQPLYTSKPDEERSGMGFTIMESFMDSLKVRSTPGKGTTVTMRRKIARRGRR